jgi:hypothetical protein
VAAALIVCAVALSAQPATRRAVDIPALVTYPGFYHTQPVVLRAELVQTGRTLVLVHPDEERAIRIAVRDLAAPEGWVEARGVFWDVGRLTADDPRVVSTNLQELVGTGPDVEWPRPGELLALQLTDAFAVDAPAVPSLRDIVLDARRYVGTEITLTGQFRGRNLYGEVAQAPGLSRWDFVLRLADAALWVTGTRPRGDGFDLNLNARLDTNKWLQVTGTVKTGGGLVWLESASLRQGEPPAEPRAVETTVPLTGPPPEVVFSSPTPGELDVGLDAPIRLQFSRDMNPDSFEGQIRVTYTGDDAPPAPAFTSPYDAATRAVTIRLDDPLPPGARFREMRIELLGGITARDGAALEPWTLAFEWGGQ